MIEESGCASTLPLTPDRHALAGNLPPLVLGKTFRAPTCGRERGRYGWTGLEQLEMVRVSPRVERTPSRSPWKPVHSGFYSDRCWCRLACRCPAGDAQNEGWRELLAPFRSPQ